MIKLRNLIQEYISDSDLKAVEKYADKLFSKVGVDINFTRHFLDRANDARNIKPINTAELIHLFKQTYRKYGKDIPELGSEAQAVIHDMENDVNVPFVLKWDGKEFDLISKTVMRKKDFKTSNKKLKV